MTNEERQMLHLLRCALWGETPQTSLFPASTSWQSVMDTAYKHTVQALVAQQAKEVLELETEEESGMDEEHKEQLIRACLSVMMQTQHDNQHLNNVLTQTARVLAQLPSPPVLLKGQGVARYYPHSGLRAPGDIDFYVGMDNIGQAIDLLKSRWPQMQFTPVSDYVKHCNTELDGVEIELHYRAISARGMAKGVLVNQWSERELRKGQHRRMEIAGSPVWVPSAQYDCLFVFYHLFYHFFFEGVGLRQLCDWALCLRHNHAYLDVSQLRATLRRFGLLRPWQVFGTLIVTHLGLPREAFPLYADGHEQTAARLLDIILSDGNFGHDQLQAYHGRGQVMGTRWLSGIAHNTQFWYRRSRIFPRQGLPAWIRYYRNGLGETWKKLLRREKQKETQKNI